MSDELLIRCCAPTLAAIKTGSLFTCGFADEDDMRLSLRALNRCLRAKGVYALPLRWREGKALVYVYRPQMLERDLNDPVAREILRACGYGGLTPVQCILRLIGRLAEAEDFPHEIGLFLGYPAVDVRGFIGHGTCKCTGLWKVYESDETEAQKIFQRCRHCTSAYLRRSQEGWSLSRLTIQPRQLSYRTADEPERKDIA